MRLTGTEPFTNGEHSVGLRVIDFWRFQYSNIDRDPEYVAEFLVAKALCKDQPDNDETWTLYDIKYDGLRIEVKETSYWHSFNKVGELSQRRYFRIPISKSMGERQCDVYVFCLLTGEDPDSANPLEIANWKFYVVSRAVVDAEFGNQKTVSLSRIQSIADEDSWYQIKDRIDALKR